MSYQTTLTLRGGPQSIEGDGTTVTPVALGQPGAALVVSMINTGFQGSPWPSEGVREASEAAAQTAIDAQYGAQAAKVAAEAARDSASGHRLNAQLAQEAAQSAATTATAAAQTATTQAQSAKGGATAAASARDAAQQTLDEVRATAANLTLAAISTDSDNRLTTGSDDGLFVPELAADPLAYYILAKA